MSGRPRVAVIGLWHLGTVTAACLAESGCDVAAFDPDPAVRASVAGARPPVHEPGLSDLLGEQLAAGRLAVAPDLPAAAGGRDVVWLCFDTPVDESDDADPTVLLETAAAAARHADAAAILAVSSQVPVGTCRRLAAATGRPVVYVMENLRLGAALERFRRPDVVVIGGDEPAAGAVAALLDPFPGPRVVAGLETAELAKHAVNAFLATSISLANELGDLAAAVGADGHAVARVMRLDRRIGERAPVVPGLGFAGGTLARDLRFLERLAGERDLPATMASAALAVNAGRMDALAGAIARRVPLAGAAVALHGLSYKAGSDTLRRSPGLALAAALAAGGAAVRASDPLLPAAAVAAAAPGLSAHDDPCEAAAGCAALVVLQQGAAPLDLGRLAAAMPGGLLVDCWAAYAPEAVAGAGLGHLVPGRAAAAPAEAAR